MLRGLFGFRRKRQGIVHQGANYQPVGTYLGDNRILSRLLSGQVMVLPASDLSVVPSIIMTGHWESRTTSYLVHTLKPGDVFVDIGANVGYYTLVAAHLVQQTGFVIAFEPQSGLVPFLQASITANCIQRFCHISNTAIGDCETTGILGHVAQLTGSASLLPGFGDGSRDGEPVRIQSLDTALEDIGRERGRELLPTMIKIDIEGYEYFAWKGMQQLVKRASDLTLIIEFFPKRYIEAGNDPFAFLDELMAAGFKLYTLKERRGELEKPPLTRPEVEEMIRADEGTDIIAEKRSMRGSRTG